MANDLRALDQWRKKAKKAKAKKRSARKAAIRVVKLPLDDPRWLPLNEARKLLIEARKLPASQIGFATDDLLEALTCKSNPLPCMRRSLTNPRKREWVPASSWPDDVEIEADDNSIKIYRGPAQAVEAEFEFEFGDVARVHRGYFRDPQTRLDEGWAYFVWKPAFDTRWSVLSPQADDGMTATRAKPGTKPKGDWPTLVGAWLILKATQDPRQLENVDALVRGAEDHLREEIDWAPENTQRIRAKILDFLQLLRR
jgi:hypothetical protein